MLHKWLATLCTLAITVILAGPVRLIAAQESAFPLPADLYILTSNAAVLRIDALTGEQTMISSDQQPVVDFDIAPDGTWWAYRTSSTNGLIVETLNGTGGYVLEFSETGLPPTTARQSLAWSPDAAHLVYLVAGGARLADLGAGEYGDARFTTLAGEWVEVYWDGSESVVALDASDNGWQLTPQDDTWAALPMGSSGARYEPPVTSSLTAEGVRLDTSGVIVPGTAGTLAFDWGLVAAARAFDADPTLPADVYYIAPDGAGQDQLWRAPASGGAPITLFPVTNAEFAYAPSPDNTHIALYGGGSLALINADGSNRQALAALSPAESEITQGIGGGLAWNADGTMLAYSDPQGLWVVPADGSAEARLLLLHTLPSETTDSQSIRVYGDPLWSPDGTRLAVSIGLYEGGYLGVVDVEAGTVIELPGAVAYESAWTDDGRLLTWSAAYGYVQPGLYALDPQQPDAAAQVILGADTSVVDVTRQGARWVALVTSTPAFGPQYVYPVVAESLDGPFTSPYGSEAGGFLQEATLLAKSDGAIYAAGLHDVSYNTYGYPVGDLVILDLASGTSRTILTSGPARDVRWAS